MLPVYKRVQINAQISKAASASWSIHSHLHFLTFKQTLVRCCYILLNFQSLLYQAFILLSCRSSLHFIFLITSRKMQHIERFSVSFCHDARVYVSRFFEDRHAVSARKWTHTRLRMIDPSFQFFSRNFFRSMSRKFSRFSSIFFMFWAFPNQPTSCLITHTI